MLGMQLWGWGFSEEHFSGFLQGCSGCNLKIGCDSIKKKNWSTNFLFGIISGEGVGKNKYNFEDNSGENKTLN